MKKLEDWEKSLNKKSFDAGITLEIRDFIHCVLIVERQKWVDKLSHGEICTNCGKEKESDLSDWCIECLENE